VSWILLSVLALVLQLLVTIIQQLFLILSRVRGRTSLGLVRGGLGVILHVLRARKGLSL
jgi:hypothetical protein